MERTHTANLTSNHGVVCNDQLTCDWKYWERFCLYPGGCIFEEKGRDLMYDYVLSYEVNGERKESGPIDEVPHIHAAIAEVRKVDPDAHMFIVLKKTVSTSSENRERLSQRAALAR